MDSSYWRLHDGSARRNLDSGRVCSHSQAMDEYLLHEKLPCAHLWRVRASTARSKRLSPLARRLRSEVLHPVFESYCNMTYALSQLTDQSHRPNYRKIGRAVRGLKRLAVMVPEAHSSRLYCVQAELCHRTGKYNEATFYYNSAYATAQQDGTVFPAAFCRERLSALKKATGKLKEARQDLIDARTAYEGWGCVMKVRQLDAALEAFDS